MRTTKHMRHRRRGIGNVIATIVFIFLLIFMTGNMMVWSILQFSDYQNVVQEMNELDSLRLGERIEISDATIDSSSRLSVTVTNTGGSTAHIVSLWVINETATPNEHLHFTQDVYISRGASDSSISTSGTVKLNTTYTIRVVTELGNIVSFKLYRLFDINLRLTLTINPPTVIDEHDVSLSLFVTNNQTGSGAVYGIEPYEPDVNIWNGTATVTKMSGPSPSSIATLTNSETAVFEWIYTIAGNAGTMITFNTTYIPRVDNNATATVQIVTGLGRYLNISELQGSAIFSPANFTFVSQTHPIGSYLAAGSDDNWVYFINSTGSLVWSRQTNGDVNTVALAEKEDGSDFFIAAGSDDNRVYLWNKAGSLVWSYQTGNDIYSVAISANGSYVVAGSRDNRVYYFVGDGGNGTAQWYYQPSNHVHSVDISADGDRVVAGGDDEYLYFWTGATTLSGGNPSYTWRYDTNGDIRSLDITKDGAYLAVGNRNSRVYYFLSSSSTPVWTYANANVDRETVKISDDGNYVVAGMGDDLDILDSTGALIWEYNAVSGVNTVSISSDGYYIVIGDNRQVRFFSRTSATPLWSYQTQFFNQINSVYVSDDGNTVVSGGNDNFIRVWKRAKELRGQAAGDGEGPAPSFTYQTSDDVQSVAFNPTVNPTVVVNNSGTVAGDPSLFVVLTVQSRLLYFNSTTQKLYTAALAQVEDSAGDIWTITPTADSGPIFPNQTATLIFNMPGDVKGEVPPGSYDAYVLLLGYDENGRTYTQTIYIGRVSF